MICCECNAVESTTRDVADETGAEIGAVIAAVTDRRVAVGVRVTVGVAVAVEVEEDATRTPANVLTLQLACWMSWAGIHIILICFAVVPWLLTREHC